MGTRHGQRKTRKKETVCRVAAETTGDTDENGNKGLDFHIAYHGSTNFLASGIAQAMQRDEFLRSIVLTAARKFIFNK